MAESTSIWREFFQSWPAELPQKGVLITNFNEHVQFVSFLVSEEIVMLERLAPDASGARRLLIPFGNILGVKIIEPVKNEVFTQAGFASVSPKPAVKPRMIPRASVPQA